MSAHFSAFKSLIVMNTTKIKRNTGTSYVLCRVYVDPLALYQYIAFINYRFDSNLFTRTVVYAHPQVHVLNAEEEIFHLLML